MRIVKRTKLEVEELGEVKRTKLNYSSGGSKNRLSEKD